MDTKQCIKCNGVFPATPEFFPRAPLNKFGVASYCKPCKRSISDSYNKANKEKKSAFMRTWRQAKGPEYQAWCAMLDRCRNPNNKQYRNYGGRGISVCAKWKSFDQFALDMGRRPSSDYSLDRIDNSGNYEPGNVRWTIAKTQQTNKRSNHLLTLNGKTQPISLWCEELGMKYTTVSERIRRYGWTIEQALTLKPQRGKKPS